MFAAGELVDEFEGELSGFLAVGAFESVVAGQIAADGCHTADHTAESSPLVLVMLYRIVLAHFGHQKERSAYSWHACRSTSENWMLTELHTGHPTCFGPCSSLLTGRRGPPLRVPGSWRIPPCCWSSNIGGRLSHVLRNV